MKISTNTLQIFLFKEREQLQHLWLPKDTNWKLEGSTRKVFEVITKVAPEETDIITELPYDFYDLVFEKESIQKIDLDPKYIDPERKVYFSPDNRLKKILDQYFGWVRWSYNQSVVIINNWFKDPNVNKKVIELVDLYKEILTNKTDNMLYIKEDSIRQAHEIYMSMLDTNKRYMEFKKRKLLIEETFTLNRKYCRKNGIYHELFKSISECVNYQLDKKIKYDLIVNKTYTDKYYICVPVKPKINFSEKQRDFNIVAIDPGVKTPFTCYDPSGKVFKISGGKSGILYELIQKRNKISLLINGLIREGNHTRAKKIHKAELRFNEKIKNLRKEFHNQTIKYLTERYKFILIPEFSNEINEKEDIHLWNHHSFRTRLFKRASEVGCIVIIADESFTTKTCGNCGNVNDVGSKSIFTCSSCEIILDRDINASRNIFVNYLAKLYN